MAKRLRLVIALLGLLLWARPVAAAYSLLGHTNGRSAACASGFTTAGVDTSGADLIVAGVSNGSGTAATISDSKSNTWSALTVQSDGGGVNVKIYYVQGGTVGSGHTFTIGGSVSCPAVWLAWFSGSVATPFDVESGADSGGAGSTTKQPGSVTPGADNELLVTATTTNGGSPAYSISSPYTITDSGGLIGGQSYGGALAYSIQTTATASNPTWTQAAANYIPVRIAVFKVSGGGGGPAGCKNGLLMSGVGCDF